MSRYINPLLVFEFDSEAMWNLYVSQAEIALNIFANSTLCTLLMLHGNENNYVIRRSAREFVPEPDDLYNEIISPLLSKKQHFSLVMMNEQFYQSPVLSIFMSLSVSMERIMRCITVAMSLECL